MLLALLCRSVTAFAAQAVAGALDLAQPLGLWIEQDSACSGCDPARGAEAGARLRISAQSVQNPFGDDCIGQVAIKPLPTEALLVWQDRLGLPPRWLLDAAGASQPAFPVPAWQLQCGRRAASTLLLLPDGDLLMPSEASTTLRFRRSPAR